VNRANRLEARGLDATADDYITKPFANAALVARARHGALAESAPVEAARETAPTDPEAPKSQLSLT